MGREDYLEEIHVRILRVTEDLRAIQRQLNCAAMEAPSDPELMEALSALPEMDALQMLKSSLDQMRHFLWFYMQVMTNESESGERLRQSIRQKVSADSVLVRRDAAALDFVIPRCIQVKAKVVSHDERESGRREILNFGHTFAHAL